MKPTDLPATREAMIRVGREAWPDLYAGAIARGEQSTHPAGVTPEIGGAVMAQQEIARLTLAELYHVSEAMTDLADAASESMPGFVLDRLDLPSDYGLIVFDRPLGVNDALTGGDVFIIAASWGLWPTCPREWVNGGIWITWYTDLAANLETAVRTGRMTREQAVYLSAGPALVLENESQIPFSDEAIPHNRDNIYAHAARVLRTSWTLMQQQNLVAARDVEPSRAERRRLLDRSPDLMKVRVITLRTAGSETGEKLHGNREYRHRWIVRGHWRQQWYASREVHRPVWIAPHIKGPEDAPILGGEKVYAWRR